MFESFESFEDFEGSEYFEYSEPFELSNLHTNLETGSPTQTVKVVTLLLHVSDQLPTSKCGGSPGLIVGNPFMPVVCRMCVDARNVVAEPGSQVCQRGKRGPINDHLRQATPLNFKSLAYPN